jgi:hypothetical protein
MRPVPDQGKDNDIRFSAGAHVAIGDGWSLQGVEPGAIPVNMM